MNNIFNENLWNYNQILCNLNWKKKHELIYLDEKSLYYIGKIMNDKQKLDKNWKIIIYLSFFCPFIC